MDRTEEINFNNGSYRLYGRSSAIPPPVPPVPGLRFPHFQVGWIAADTVTADDLYT